MEYWQTLNPRERLLLIVGAVALLLILIWAFFWEPLHKKQHLLEQNIEKNTELVEWMTQSSQKVLLARNLRPSGSRNSPLYLIAGNVLDKHKLRPYLQNMKPQGDNERAQITLKGVSFDAVMRFLGELDSRHHIQCQRFSLKTGDNPGQVDINMVLERS